MKLMDAMNYRYNNPEVNLNIDETIVNTFLRNPKEEIKDQFELWASMSKENVKDKLVTMIKNTNLEQTKTK